MTKAAIYLRVSTTSFRSCQGDGTGYDRNPEIQEQSLRDLVAQRGWQVHKVYSDQASGARERRPGLDALVADAPRREFTVVVVWSFDRFALSTRQLVFALEEFRALGIDFISHEEAVDTSTPMGKAVFPIIAAMAGLERSIIRERIVASLEHARHHGTKTGRPAGRPRAVFRRDEVTTLRAPGVSLRKIARKLGIGLGTVRDEPSRTAPAHQRRPKAQQQRSYERRSNQSTARTHRGRATESNKDPIIGPDCGRVMRTAFPAGNRPVGPIRAEGVIWTGREGFGGLNRGRTPHHRRQETGPAPRVEANTSDKPVPREIAALLSGERVILRETQRAVTPFGGVAVCI